MRWALVATVAASLLATACDKKSSSLAPSPSALASAAVPEQSGIPAFDPSLLEAFQPLPAATDEPVLDDATKLGQMLWFDARLSRGQDVACNGCHDLARGGMDNQPLSTGTKGKKTRHNTPTILNAGAAFAQGWEADWRTVEELVPPHIKDVFDREEASLVELVGSIPAYVAAFEKAYPGVKITGGLVARSLATFVKKLVARSRWDRYLEGDTSALSPQELGGFAMFVAAKCPTCHQGKLLGAMENQKLGIAKPWPGPAGQEPGLFKNSSLRNVWRTEPWLHDGSVTTLEETISLMARCQNGRVLSAVQVVAIATFLATLEGDPPKALAAKPALPPNGPKTPKPE